MVRKLVIVVIVIGVILIAGVIHIMTFDPFRDDVLDGTSEQLPPLTTDNLRIVSCPTGFSQSHLDVFGENTFNAIPICVSNSGIGFLGCNEETINSEGMIEKVECEVIVP